jgi:hypothetical protein
VLSHHNNSLTIIDIDNDEVLAFVGLIEDKDSFIFDVFASEEGYDTTILEATLMFTYPKGVIDNREGDINIWENIYNNDGIVKDKLEYGTKLMMVPTDQYEKLINLSVLLNHEEIYKQGRDYYRMRFIK